MSYNPSVYDVRKSSRDIAIYAFSLGAFLRYIPNLPILISRTRPTELLWVCFVCSRGGEYIVINSICSSDLSHIFNVCTA